MTVTLVATPPAPDNGTIRASRLAWIAETLRLPTSLSQQALRAPGRTARTTLTAAPVRSNRSTF